MTSLYMRQTFLNNLVEMGKRYVVSLVLFHKSIKISQTKYIKKRKKEKERTRDDHGSLGFCGQSDGGSLDPLRVWLRA